MSAKKPIGGALTPYFLLTYAAVLVQSAAYLRETRLGGLLTVAFVLSTGLVYSLIMLAPVMGLTYGCRRLLRLPAIRRVGLRLRLSDRWIIYGVALISAALLQVLLYADRFIYDLYGFHLNGFVWNLLTTRGGLASLGGEESTTISFALIISGLVAGQVLLLLVAAYVPHLGRAFRQVMTRKTVVYTASAFAVMALFEQAAFGICKIRGYTPVLAASDAFPLYFPITFTSLAKSMGFHPVEEPLATADVGGGKLRYPLHPLEFAPSPKSFNMVWLVAESLRWDMLDPEIMPRTWAFAQQATWCRRHYSGGNGTRMAMFSLFYGLYGPYWFSFVDQRRGPVLMDVMVDRGYDIDLFTSAGFSYPEFDRTIFVRVPQENLHELVALPIWWRDAQQVKNVLASIDQRDADRPFMRFMFFETPHANYHFPETAVIREPYLKSLNYATMDLERDIGLMKNRYINASHYLDEQIGRVIDHLRERGLLDSTILLITGDHGEEFMEHGHWGHNSGYCDQQTRVPFVLWMPGRPPQQIDRLTSHLDIPATLLPELGVTNPPSDYSQGVSLYDRTGQGYTMICSWDDLAYVSADWKAVIPMRTYGFVRQPVTTGDDQPVEDRSGFFAAHRDRLISVMGELKRFKE